MYTKLKQFWGLKQIPQASSATTVIWHRILKLNEKGHTIICRRLYHPMKYHKWASYLLSSLSSKIQYLYIISVGSRVVSTKFGVKRVKEHLL